MRVLFVCSRNQWRSPTAERVFAGREGLETRSRGVSRTARRRLSRADVAWADVILVMEDEHLERLMEGFRAVVGDTPVFVLDVADEYRYMDPELVAELEAAAGPLIERVRRARGEGR